MATLPGGHLDQVLREGLFEQVTCERKPEGKTRAQGRAAKPLPRLRIGKQTGVAKALCAKGRGLEMQAENGRTSVICDSRAPEAAGRGLDILL